MQTRSKSTDVSSTDAMEELEPLLARRILEVQKHRHEPRKRREAIDKLWDAMMPSSSKLRQRKPSDFLAKKRLKQVKNSLRDRYEPQLKKQFEDCWVDALADAQLEFLEKIDIYNRGVDYTLFKHWQKLGDCLNKLPPEERQQICQEFSQHVEKFRIRFEKRLEKRENIAPETSKALAHICQEFCNSLEQIAGENPAELQQIWDNFGDKFQAYYTPKSVWNWFRYILENRFTDLKNKALKIREVTETDPITGEKFKKIVRDVSGDQPVGSNRDSEEEAIAIFDTFICWQKEDEIEAHLPKPKDLVELLEEDPYGVFSSQHVKGYPEINFRAIALLRNKDLSWNDIGAHFGNRVGATKTISPFYSRKKDYFEAIIKEYLGENFPLPAHIFEEIETDADGKFAKKKMKECKQVSFQSLAIRKAKAETWEKVAADLEVEDIKSLILFYLDGISYFKLLPKEKKNKQKNTDKNPH